MPCPKPMQAGSAPQNLRGGELRFPPWQRRLALSLEGILCAVCVSLEFRGGRLFWPHPAVASTPRADATIFVSLLLAVTTRGPNHKLKCESKISTTD
jgi:hypothetical protein